MQAMHAGHSYKHKPYMQDRHIIILTKKNKEQFMEITLARNIDRK